MARNQPKARFEFTRQEREKIYRVAMEDSSRICSNLGARMTGLDHGVSENKKKHSSTQLNDVRLNNDTRLNK